MSLLIGRGVRAGSFGPAFLLAERGELVDRDGLGHRLERRRRIARLDLERAGQRLHKLGRSGKSIAALLGQRPGDDRVDRLRQVGAALARLRDRTVHVSQNHLEAVLVVIGRRARQGLECDHAERVDVGRLVRHTIRAGLLRSHVAWRSDHKPGARQLLVPSPGGARDPEIGEERVSLPIDHHVGRLEIPVHHSLPVRIVERPRQLAKDVEKLVPRHLALLLHLLQGAALQVPHDDVRRVVLAIEVVDRKKVGMLEPRDEACLALEALPKRLIVENVRVDDLDGHVAVHARLVGPEDSRHPTRADFLGDLIGPQLLPDHRVEIPCLTLGVSGSSHCARSQSYLSPAALDQCPFLAERCRHAS